jgi:hypothetical protein
MRPVQSAVTYVSDFVSTLQGAVPKRAGGSGARPEFELGVHPAHVSRYLSFLKVEPVRNTSLAAVQFTTTDPLSQELAAAHATNFIRMNLETRFELTKEARSSAKKLVSSRLKSRNPRKRCSSFASGTGWFLCRSRTSSSIGWWTNKRLTEARAKRIELESLSRIVKDKNVEFPPGHRQHLILQLKGRLRSIEAEQARLATF